MDEDGIPVDSNPTGNASSVGKFVSPGILLFIDQLIIAAGGWIYWLAISRLTTTSDIGHATTIYSLALLTTTITQLGLEYPLLRKSHAQRSRILGTAMFLELAITSASIPVFLYTIIALYEEQLYQFASLAIGILVFTSIGFISRFALLGLSDAKTVLLFDIIGVIIKFVIGFFLVSLNYGAYGILISFLVQTVIVTGGTLFVAKKSFVLSMGDSQFLKEILAEGLVNMPSKLARMLIPSLTIILLAFMGVSSSDIGIFYIALMISLVVGSFSSSIAFMSIPASSISNSDLSSISTRISLSITALFIVLLIFSSHDILSIIGSEYGAADQIVTVLALGIFPATLVSNTIAKLNNLKEWKKIIKIGIIQFASFLTSFYLLVPEYGTLGAAYSILLAFIITAVVSLTWNEKYIFKYLTLSALSIMSGIFLGKLIENFVTTHPLPIIFCSSAIALTIILISKCISITEIRSIAKPIIRR